MQKEDYKFISKENKRLFFHEILNKSGLKYIVTLTHCTNSEIKGDTFLDFEWNMKCIGFTMLFFSLFVCLSLRLKADNLLQSSTLRVIFGTKCDLVVTY